MMISPRTTPGNLAELSRGWKCRPQILERSKAATRIGTAWAVAAGQIELRYQPKRVLGDHAFVDAEAVGVFVCLGNFSFAEPFKCADGIVGGAFDDSRRFAVALAGVNVDGGAGQKALRAGYHQDTKARPFNTDSLGRPIRRLECLCDNLQQVSFRLCFCELIICSNGCQYHISRMDLVNECVAVEPY